METTTKTKVTVECIVNATIDRIWDCWNNPSHITQWCFASDDWHAPFAENVLRTGGKFKIRMEAKDGSMGFDFEGVYTNVKKNDSISYAMADGRTVDILFAQTGNSVKVTETFVAENENPVEMQQQGWQAILNNFKNFTENI